MRWRALSHPTTREIRRIQRVPFGKRGKRLIPTNIFCSIPLEILKEVLLCLSSSVDRPFCVCAQSFLSIFRKAFVGCRPPSTSTTDTKSLMRICGSDPVKPCDLSPPSPFFKLYTLTLVSVTCSSTFVMWSHLFGCFSSHRYLPQRPDQSHEQPYQCSHWGQFPLSGNFVFGTTHLENGIHRGEEPDGNAETPHST